MCIRDSRSVLKTHLTQLAAKSKLIIRRGKNRRQLLETGMAASQKIIFESDISTREIKRIALTFDQTSVLKFINRFLYLGYNSQLKYKTVVSTY